MNYWGDSTVARTVLLGLEAARQIAAPAAGAGTPTPGDAFGIPTPLKKPLVGAALGGAAVLAVVSLAVAAWLVVPGVGHMLRSQDVVRAFG